MKVGPYSFDAVLHTGSSRLVYAGTRDGDEVPVVGKVATGPHHELAHEFLWLERLAGPGIVEALGLFDSTSGQVLVQRRFGAGSLGEAVRDRQLSVDAVLRLGLQLAQICARIHALGILHRDIKPANILYDPEREAIAIANVRLAAELPVNARALPVGDFVGTPGYASPEHTGRTSQGCDARSDLYSVGVTLYELLTGTLPFPERDLLELIAAHLSRTPDSPHHRAPSVPPIVGDIVMKLLAKAPDERYQSARGLAADLERCLATLADGKIAAFELGRSDLLRPRFAPQLFGRDDELAVLRRAFTRAATGAPTVVLISGRDGSGRSELVRALVRDVAEASPLALGGWIAATDRPLVGLADALGSLANRLLPLDEDRLAALRRQFAQAMGQIGRVVLDIAPALADVFGEQPALIEVGPEAARARLQHSFRCFASALGEPVPFVLALRGYEHADPASISLVHAILSSPTSCAALIVLIAHDPSAFGALRDRPDAVSIELGPLSLSAVCAWTAAALGGEPDHAAALGELLHAKTAGNPLILVRLVEHLVEIGAIARSDGAYVWSVNALRDVPAPPTLGALAAQRIAELDPASRMVLAAAACADEPIGVAALAAMTAPAAGDTDTVADHAAAMVREGLLAGGTDSYRVAHPVIAQTALAAMTADEVARMRGRLGRDLLVALSPGASGAAALRVALLLSRGTAQLAGADRVHAAAVFALAGEHVMASGGYDVAATLFEAASGLLDDARDAFGAPGFRIDMGRVRALMMLGRRGEAGARFEAIAARDLTPPQIGVLYAAWCGAFTIAMECDRAIEVGLAGLKRLGIDLPAQPRPLQPLAAVRLNQRYLAKLTTADHLLRPDATDERALAAMKILSTVTIPTVYTGRSGLNLLISETAISLLLRYGHVRNTSGFLAVHASILHALRGDYAAARRIYEACDVIETARPSPELVGRTAIALHYALSPWFGSWQEAANNVQRAIRLCVEVGDPVFSALCASASVTLLFMTGAPLDRLVAAVQGWGPFFRGDAGASAHAANVTNITGKLSRGEPIAQDDLDRITNVPVAAGSPRNSPMVNLGLALSVIGHDRQVRAWLDEIRERFPRVNFSQPHLVTLWLLDGLFAAVDARTDPARRPEAERILGIFHMLKRETRTVNNDPAIALIEAHLAHADGDLDRASGLFGRAARDARAKDLTPLVAYACEQRAKLFGEAGYPDDALMYYREAAAAYRRWAHLTKVAELEQAHPALRLREARDDARRPGGGTMTSTGPIPSHTVDVGASPVNDQLDLLTVLKVSQDISMQLTGSAVARAVLIGIAQNAGAERVVLVVRQASGIETVYGEVQGGAYQDVGVALDSYAALPRSVMRVVRRTGRPLVVADAINDVGHAADPYVVESRCRSIVGIPVRRSAEITGFVLLENRMVAGAFTPQLVRLTQALVAQAAIALDNASLYQNLENRVAERTAALDARNAEMRLVLDHVAQGLVMVGRDGRLFAERSASLATWFPDGMPEALIGLFAADEGAAAWFDLVWEQLVDCFLPLDLALAQLPRQLPRGDRILAIDWQPILGETGGFERMLVVLSDVTEAVRRVEAEREQKQLMAVLEALSEDRNGVIELLKDASAIVAELAAGRVSAEVEKRLIHTLKGNTALFGLSALAARCHDIEDAMELDARPMTADERAGLATAWQALRDKLARVIDIADDVVEVRRADYDAVLTALRRDGHPAAHDVELWTLEPLRVRFQRIAEQARALAERLGKGPVQIELEPGRLYLETAVWAPFWSAFVHVVRNAVDHGLETADERARLGKGIATLTLRGQFLAGRAGALVLEMSDDGRGISWDALRDKAQQAGLPAETRADLIAAMFHDGISTRSEANEISGRGVGLGALAAVCRTMGCEISVDSAAGRGTTLRFELPAHLAKVRRSRPGSLELVPMTSPS